MKTISLRRLSSIPITSGLGLPGDQSIEGDPRYIRTTDIATPRSLKSDTIVTQPYNVAKKALLKPGDLLLVSAGASIGKSLLFTSSGPSCYAGFLVRVRPFSRISGEFLSYWTESPHFTDQVRANAVQSTIENFSASRYKELEVPDLSEGQQERILHFLDERTAKIDELISLNQRQCELLEERVASEIEKTALSGLKGKTEWDKDRVKHLFHLRNEHSYVPRDEVTLLSLYTKYGVLKYDDIEQRSGNPVRTVDGYKVVQSNDIVVNIILAWMGAIGRSPYAGVISPAYDIWIPEADVSSRYFHYLFRTKWFSGECFKRGKGIMLMRWRTYAEQFGDIAVPVPPFAQQEEIADYLDEQTADSRVLVNKHEAMISLLQERRSALITAAVTGQIEV